MISVHRGQRFPAGLTSPDVYFTPGYGSAAALADGGEWVLLKAFDGAWQMPLIVRTLVDGTQDAISPYGYSGVYASPSLSSAAGQDAWRQTVSCLRELGIISVLLRHSPLVPQARDLTGLQPVVSAHPTIVVEVDSNSAGNDGAGSESAGRDSAGSDSAGSDAAWDGLASTCRTRIRKALKNGYIAAVRPATWEDLAPGGHFRRLYEQTMQRLDAAPLYYFSEDYYTRLAQGLGDNLLLSEVVDATGLPVSSALLLRHGHQLHYHLAGSNVDDARMGTNNLMMWTAIQYTAEQGLRQFHLGGGLVGRDGLYKFKHTFGGRELEYNVTGLIVEAGLYQGNVERRAKECDTTPELLLTSGFFPAYRAGAG